MSERRLDAHDLVGAEILNVATNEEFLSEFTIFLIRTVAGVLAEVYINGTGEYMKATVQDIREENENSGGKDVKNR